MKAFVLLHRHLSRLFAFVRINGLNSGQHIFPIVPLAPVSKQIHFSSRALSKNDSIETWTTQTALTVETMRYLLNKKKIVLIDVRDQEDVEKHGMIEGAINIPLNQLKKSLEINPIEFAKAYDIEKPKTSAENVIFYGKKDVSGAAACEIAHNLGYKKSKYFKGGWSSWVKINK